MSESDELLETAARVARSRKELREALNLSEATFSRALLSGDVAAASLAHAQLSEALNSFREVERTALVELHTGHKIAVIDYLGLQQVANDNGVPGSSILSGIRSVDEAGRVKGLEIEFLGISDISGLRNLTSLTDLGLMANKITDIARLEKLTALKVLSLSDNEISDIAPLSNLRALRGLFVSGNQITDSTPLADLPQLTLLNLCGNKISEIGPLAKLTKLHTLCLGENEICDVGPLGNLTGLTVLELFANRISDVSPLAKLVGLTTLWLHGNKLSELAPLATLSGLQVLSVGHESPDMACLQPLVTRGCRVVTRD